MKTHTFDVVIIGAGPAGVAAAGALAGSGISVALVEAGVYAGAENWSGCVYFTENLAEKDCFGPLAVEEAPYERAVVRRGTLLHNGLDVVGMALTDPSSFRHCYTVLRPVYDPYFANLARAKGAFLLTETAVTSLVRKQGRIVGVSTDRGLLHAAVVFIAEGDASHLVRSERLERVTDPHYLQGVKAVLNLPAEEIERRFDLRAGEGAAFEILLRNASIAGRTAQLNAGGFLYTNRDSLSFGYVVPLDTLQRHYRGDQSLLLEWMRSLPFLSDLTEGARLSAWGAKIIRSGGWRERPVLAEDGLAVGGASAGFGIDVPFPNFTGPASATGLFFARAVKDLLRDGKSLDAKNLTAAYLDPLRASVYGRNAQHLSRWPSYFGRSRVLFGRTVDVVCGTARFLSTKSLVNTGRFLRGHILSLRGMRELAADAFSLASSLRLWKPLFRELVNPGTYGAWTRNLFRRQPPPDPRLRIIIQVEGRTVDTASLPWPIGGLIARVAPALARALAVVYANDGRTAERKFPEALRLLLRSLRVADFITLPFTALAFGLASLITAVWDAFRYYVLRTPAATMLVETVMAYAAAQRKARDLSAIRPRTTIEEKLASNTYRIGTASHIRTLWPERVADHPALARSALWWVCPARVYAYDAPLAGRGRVTVNWENCIKCESCWRAEPGHVLWGRFTDHRLIYRPDTSAVALLLQSLHAPPLPNPGKPPAVLDEHVWYAGPAIEEAVKAALNAAAAYREAVAALPASADAGRRSWPRALGRRFVERLDDLEAVLANDGRSDAAAEVRAERKDIKLRVDEGMLFHALYRITGLEQHLHLWFGPRAARDGTSDAAMPAMRSSAPPAGIAYEDVSRLFPDRMVQQWEDEPMDGEGAERLLRFITDHRDAPLPALRALSAVSPALGLIAARQMLASCLLDAAGRGPAPGICAVTTEGLVAEDIAGGARVTGTLHLVPAAACASLFVIKGERGFRVALNGAGVAVDPTPAIGFRAAGLADVKLDCVVNDENIVTVPADRTEDHAFYLAVALGAGDYLSRRAREHAAGRVQFPGQMLDTEGRDGIAKLGAVKALVARIEAWRLALDTLHDQEISAHRPPEHGLLCSALAALAFGPGPGCMAYDAGQVFGGFAYSEDDLLARFYRDSALFPFLAPGHGAAPKLHAALTGTGLEQALPREFGSLMIVRGGPLAPLAGRWRDCARRYQDLPSATDARRAGEAAAVLLVTRRLIVRVEDRLNEGSGSEPEAAAVAVLLDIADDLLVQAFLSAGRGRVPPAAVFPLTPSAARVPLDLEYEAFCEAPGLRHRSGGFLLSVFDRSPRYVPEMQLHDFWLHARWKVLAEWFQQNCSGKQWDGMAFERYVEKGHDLPVEIIRAVRERKWLATVIPRSLDGLGWRKAEYYVLNAAAGAFSDAAVCLLIMASTSIGTTPVLLGLEEELPRVREELDPLVKDERRLGEIGTRLRRIIAILRNPDPARIRKEYEAVMRLVDSRIRSTRVVKYLAANFLRAFYGAGIAGRQGDFGGFVTGLTAAADLFDQILPEVRAALDELPRRERCHRLFLRSLGHGGVSAFALTEPTAGSDSGGVRTTAHLRRVRLHPLPDGRYVFLLDETDERSKRYLIDADRIVFTPDGMAYRAPDDTLCPVRERQKDDAEQSGRSYSFQGQDREFHDIAQVRATQDGPGYEFFSLTGAKMWITNAGIATQFSLYAQTPEGVTGFMVDRHAEGFIVGADERKMGQRGSPTNEISLDSVRVPREAVIGYEGHGQVNALETLNVGRCGLAVVSGALAHKVLDEAARNVPPSPERDRLLGEAAAVLFGSESLAYYLIGLFDRPHESVRMESAVAKYLCSEDIHEVLSLVEAAYGPPGQTERFLLEKARRDARILTIYEGTNEVQRFLILKDLIARAGEWPLLPERLHERPQDERAMLLSRRKNRLRHHVRTAEDRLGDAAWSDAMLQPALFLLAETAGELLRLECTWYRMEWLEERRERLGLGYVGPLLAAGGRAAERSLLRLDHLEARFTAAWKRIESDQPLPEVRAADALLDRMPAAAPPATPFTAITTPVRILCILRPVADLAPAPRIIDGRIDELVWRIDPFDRAAVVRALAIKAAKGPDVVVDVLMPGRPADEQLLNMAVAGIDERYRIDGDPDIAPGNLAQFVQDLHSRRRYDLIVAGAYALDGGPSLPAYLAGFLGLPYHAADAVSVESSAPTVIGTASPDPPSAGPDIAAVIEAHLKTVTVLRSAVRRHLQKQPAFLPSAVKPAMVPAVTTVAEAATFLKAYAASARPTPVEAFRGAVSAGELNRDRAVWAMLDAGRLRSNVAVLRTERVVAEASELRSAALIAAPQASWPDLLGLAKANGVNQAFCIDTGEGYLSPEGRHQIIRKVVKQAGATMVVAGMSWNEALAAAAGELLASADRAVPVVAGITDITRTEDGRVVLRSPAYEGRLMRQAVIVEEAAFVSVAEEAELPAVPAASDIQVMELDMPLSPDWIESLPETTGASLAQAEVIIDVGYGIRDRAGLELAMQLKESLERRGLTPMLGATRKVTQDLKLLPLEAQIGQTGIRVNPKLIIALGISGAPQHTDYLGGRADVLCFNKDPEAPLMKLNTSRPTPRIHPVPGDLFVTVSELISLLGSER